MSQPSLPENLRLFLFEHIDSVELIEILLALKAHADGWKTAAELNNELRSSEHSVEQRLRKLIALKLVESENGRYHYKPETSELDLIVQALSVEFKLRRHRVFEIVFSSAKRARSFAEAFVLTKDSGKKEEPDNG